MQIKNPMDSAAPEDFYLRATAALQNDDPLRACAWALVGLLCLADDVVSIGETRDDALRVSVRPEAT